MTNKKQSGVSLFMSQVIITTPQFKSYKTEIKGYQALQFPDHLTMQTFMLFEFSRRHLQIHYFWVSLL